MRNLLIDEIINKLNISYLKLNFDVLSLNIYQRAYYLKGESFIWVNFWVINIALNSNFLKSRYKSNILK